MSYGSCQGVVKRLSELHRLKDEKVKTYETHIQHYFESSGNLDSHTVRLSSDKYIIEQINSDIKQQSDLMVQLCKY